MKYIKKINEDYSDYTTDFSDNGFEIEETPSSIKGSISKGKFLVTDLNNWFTEMADKLSIEYKVLSAKTFFNQVTGNANFEIVLDEPNLEGININIDGNDVLFIPKKITHVGGVNRPQGESWIDAYIRGKLSSGQNKSLRILFVWNDDGKKTIKFFLGVRERGITVTRENLEKFFTLVDSGQVEFVSENEYATIERFKEYLNILKEKILQ